MNEKLQDLLGTIQRTAVQAGDVAADAAYGVSKKASALLSTAKLNIRVCELKSDVNEAFRQVGEMLYATHTGNHTDSDDLVRKLEEIDALKAQIDDLNAQIGRAGEAGTCPVCGANARSGDAFCRECGSSLKKEAPAAQPPVTPADIAEEPVVTAADPVDTDPVVVSPTDPVTPEDFAD